MFIFSNTFSPVCAIVGPCVRLFSSGSRLTLNKVCWIFLCVLSLVLTFVLTYVLPWLLPESLCWVLPWVLPRFDLRQNLKSSYIMYNTKYNWLVLLLFICTNKLQELLSSGTFSQQRLQSFVNGNLTLLPPCCKRLIKVYSTVL